MTTVAAQEYIDLDRYPIDQMGSTRFEEMLAGIHADLEATGCAVLESFVRPDRVGELIEEAERVAPFAHRSYNRTNAYFTKDNPSLPENHPVRRFYDRSNAFVPADNFGDDSILRAIYEWPPFAPFIQHALREDAFYRYADPLADVIINAVEPGGGFPWHFDTNNYTVTLAIQNGEGGGLFEYSPRLRTAEDENYDGVSRILDGSLEGVVSFELKPGDLQIFLGRYTLHRVSAVEGSRSRYVGIFSYAEQPDMVASPERCKQLYGRVLPIHFERAGQRLDTLID